MVNKQPDTYPTVNVSLCVDGATAAIEFYKQVLGATERMRFAAPDGKIGHAELQIGDSVIMLADEFPEMGFVSTKTVGGTPVSVLVYVDDADAAFKRALDAGAVSISEPSDQFYGDRSGQFEDPFGHRWVVATHIEDVPVDEMQRRAAAMMGG